MISVLMSVFNEVDQLESCARSVMGSVCSDAELIFVDDCSSDGSAELLETLSDSTASIIFIKNKENLGLAKSLNIAAARARYYYIARMDADDICERDRFRLQLQYMDAHPEIDILGGNALLIDSDSIEIGKTDVPLDHDSIVKALAYRNPMIHPTIMMKREVLETLGGYDECLLKAQDLDLWHRAVRAGFRFANLSDYLIKYRVDLDKPTITIFKGFWVSFRHAIRNRSVKGIGFSILDLVKYFMIKLRLYTPRSLRKKK
jgi:glycosyltransferase involved in cell wall biosynthesis